MYKNLVNIDGDYIDRKCCEKNSGAACEERQSRPADARQMRDTPVSHSTGRIQRNW